MISFPVALIENVLRVEDIEGLLELGAPQEEYCFEAKAIASQLAEFAPGAASEEDIAAVITKIWAKSFELADEDLDKRHAAIVRVAHQIIASCSETNP